MSAAANWSGKARTIISFPTICAVYYYLQAPADFGWRFPFSFVLGLEFLGAAVNALSIVIYTIQYWPALRAEIPQPPTGSPGAG